MAGASCIFCAILVISGRNIFFKIRAIFLAFSRGYGRVGDMKAKQYHHEAFAQAERIVSMTMDEAKALPGLLAPVVSGALARDGYSTRIMENQRTFILLA